MAFFDTVAAGTSPLKVDFSRADAAANGFTSAASSSDAEASMKFASLLLAEPSTVPATTLQATEEIGISAVNTVQNSVLLPPNVAVEGEGYLVVSDPAGTTYLTREGSFSVHENGNISDADGNTLLGYPHDSSAAHVATDYSQLEPVNLPTHFPGDGSSYSTFSGNLDASADVVDAAALPSATSGVNTRFTNMTFVDAYDTQGKPVRYDVYFSKTGVNSWQVSIFDAAGRNSTTNAFPYAPGSLVTSPIDVEFDAFGKPIGLPSDLTLPGSEDGGSVPNMRKLELYLSQLTQVAGEFSVRTVTNGSQPCSLEQVQISEDGTVYAQYTGRELYPRYHLAMATVGSPTELEVISDNLYLPNDASGLPAFSTAESGGKGSIVSGTIDVSQVQVGPSGPKSNLIGALAYLGL